MSKYIHASRYNSRRFPIEGSVSYLTDAEIALEKRELLTQIETKVTEAMAKVKIPDETQIRSAITETLKGLDLEALRAYNLSKTEMETTIRTMSAQVAEFKKIIDAGEGQKRNLNHLKETLEKNMDAIGKVMRSKDAKQTIVINTRAAVIMEMDNAIDEPNDMPDDIIESFSVDSMVKKRRPNEYIFQIANRRTIPAITEYKTWLEEGDQEGAYAIIEEGELKPLVSANLVRNWTKYQKIAGKRVYTEEFAKFRKEAFRIIEDLLNDKLVRDYSAVLTTALLTKAATYAGTSLDGQFAEPTDWHAVGAVASQIETLEFNPDLLIINSQDKWRIGLAQNSQGTFFMNIPTYDPSGEVRMLGFRIFTSNRIPVGTAILGESGLYKIEDEPVQIRMGYGIDVVKDVNGFVTEVTSDIDTNRFRIIAETFFRSWIATLNLGSFVSFNFADVKLALKSEV